MNQYLQPRTQPNRPTKDYPTEPFNLESVKQFTIGRTHDNTLQLLDNTISKKHAKISEVKGNRHWLIDLQSANGVLVNGVKVEGKKMLEHNDCIQFGKYDCLFEYIDKINSGNKERLDERKKSRGKSRGRINLKDYFETETNSFAGGIRNEKSERQLPSRIEGDQDSTVTKPRLKSNMKNRKPKESKIKIPDISNFLKIDEDFPQRQYETQSTGKNFNRPPQAGIQSKLKLSNAEDLLDDEERRKFDLYQKEKNLYIQEQQALKEVERQRRAAEEQRLRVELQQARTSQDLIQKQLLLEQQVRKEQKNLQMESEKIQQELLARQQLKRKEEMKRIRQIQAKEKEMIQKLEEERNLQLQELKEKEQRIKRESENLYRGEYESRKRQLEMEAEALARQYENIYREAIRKVRTEIDNEQATLQKMQAKSQTLKSENQELESKIESLKEAIRNLQRQYITISGRNKACIIYASDIQDKIDGMSESKEQRKHKDDGYYHGSTKPGSNLGQLRSSIVNSRKLLRLKKQQYENVYSEITALSGSIKEMAYPASSDLCDYLETIVDNAKTIQKLKEEYLQLIEGEKSVEDQWDVEVAENSELGDKNRLLESQIRKNVRELDQNTRDQIKKSTEQRLHMLKLMHFCQQQKKDAAKFLIEEMLGIEQEIHKFMLQNEEYHQKIGQVITESEKLKREDEYLSEILFGQDENCHHFDNMKQVINTLLRRIGEEKETNAPVQCLQAAKEGMKIELSIQYQTERRKQIKERMRKIAEMGISSTKNRPKEKNPLVFFGDLLTKKQLEQDSRSSAVASLQKQVRGLKDQLRLLEQKKKSVSDIMQKFKIEQLNEAKKYLLGNQ